jgi:hypothetical protein
VVSLHARDGQTRIRMLTWRDCSPGWNHLRNLVSSAIEEVAGPALAQATEGRLA